MLTFAFILLVSKVVGVLAQLIFWDDKLEQRIASVIVGIMFGVAAYGVYPYMVN